MLNVAVTIASNPLSVSACLNQFCLCMSRRRLLKIHWHYTWPQAHVFRHPILFIPKFQYRKGVSTTRLESRWIVGQTRSLQAPTCHWQSHSTMTPTSIVSRRIIFFPWQTIHTSPTVDMKITTKVVTPYRRAPLAVSAWSTVMSGTKNGWSRWTPTLTLLSLTLRLFCQIMMRQRHSLETRTTTSCCMLKSLALRLAPFIRRWRRQITGLPHISQITTPMTLIIITCDCWSPGPFLAHSYKLCPELVIERQVVSNLPYAHPMIPIFCRNFRFILSVLLCSRNYTSWRQFLFIFWRAI